MIAALNKLELAVMLITVTLPLTLSGSFELTAQIATAQSQTPETGSVTDIDGNTYKTVRIGTQWWMAENLRVTRNPSGNPIQSYVYHGDQSLLASYGRLYTWDVAMNGAVEPGAQGIAPDGWRIPSTENWNTLFEYLGGDSIAGGILKQAGTSRWQHPNVGASDGVAFAGLPGGGYDGRTFDGMGVGGHFWSSTGDDSEAGLPTLHRDTGAVVRLSVPKFFAASIRCVKDHIQ